MIHMVVAQLNIACQQHGNQLVVTRLELWIFVNIDHIQLELTTVGSRLQLQEHSLTKAAILPEHER